LATAPTLLPSFGWRLAQEDGAFAAFEPVRGHRYCQALMKARHGESVLLEPAGLSCPTAAAAFGFRQLAAATGEREGATGHLSRQKLAALVGLVTATKRWGQSMSQTVPAERKGN
jgi:uncharacterized protein (DUF169 family)